jgi:hypothetical protein
MHSSMSTSKSNSKSNSSNSNAKSNLSNPTQTPCCSSRQTVSKMAVCTHLRAIKQQALENFNTIQEYIQACNVRLMESTKVNFTKFNQRSNSARYRFLNVLLAELTLAVFTYVYIAYSSDAGSMVIYLNISPNLNIIWVSSYFFLTFYKQAVDVSHNQIFCATCGDYVYDTDFDIAVAMAKTKATVAKHNVQGRVFHEISMKFQIPSLKKLFIWNGPPPNKKQKV